MIHLDTLSTLVAATLVLLLGRKLVHSVSFLKKYTIPDLSGTYQNRFPSPCFFSVPAGPAPPANHRRRVQEWCTFSAEKVHHS